MRAALSGWCLGILGIAWAPDLPTVRLLIGACLGVSLLATLGRARPFLLALAWGLSLGALWHWWWAEQLVAERLPVALEGVDLLLSGRIASLPVSSGRGQRFAFDIDGSDARLPGRRLLLTDYDGLALGAGERWRLPVRLKRPHGSANPAGVDYEAWLARERIAATGYVRSATAQPRRLQGPALSLNGWRQGLARRLAGLTASTRHPGLILALTLGEQSGIDGGEWTLFSLTGTTHLFIVSGLHIGMVAALAYWLGQALARCSVAVMTRLPAQKVGAVAAILGGASYSLLSGFGLPAQRALVMLTVFMAALWLDRRIAVSARYLMAMALVLALNPLAGTGAGFWLSFIAVAALVFDPRDTRGDAAEPGGRVRHWLRRWVSPQLRIALALSLPLLIFMQQASLVAPLVNLAAIPVLGFVVVPLCLSALLVSTFSGPVAQVLFLAADAVLSTMVDALGFIVSPGAFPDLLLTRAITAGAAVFLGLAVLLALLPARVGGPVLFLPLLLPALLPLRDASPPLVVDVLDVGQGAAVIVQAGGRTLVYDAGPAQESGFDSGRAIVVPALRRLGLRWVDVLVISHGDADHAGGAAELLASLPVDLVLSGAALPDFTGQAGPPTHACRGGQDWQWGEVVFRMLHPPHSGLQGNERSCVLQVCLGRDCVLLPGDIGRRTELDLVRRYGSQLASRVLLTPHHGSGSSSSYGFLKWVHPEVAVHSAGYRNAFGHPAAAVRRRYQALGIRQITTAASGRVRLEIGAGQRRVAVSLYRERHRRYWRSQRIAAKADNT